MHAYVGEERPNAEAIEHIVKQTLEQTRCSQLVFSPTYTECDLCGEVMPGSKDLCTQQTCQNSSEETKLKGTLFTVTRIVGYYSRVANWNDSQKQIFKDREKVEKYYAGKSGRKMDWLYSPGVNGKLIIKEFGKHGCPNCKILETTIKNKIKELKIQDLVDFKMYYLDELDERVLAEAALYDVPMDSVPTLVIGGKKKIWKKTTVYASNCQSGVCSVGGSGVKETILITPNEIESNILELINDYQK